MFETGIVKYILEWKSSEIDFLPKMFKYFKLNHLKFKPFGYKKKTDQSIDLIVKSSVTITHDEHAKMVLEPGTYSKTNQMEFDPFNNTVSYIFD